MAKEITQSESPKAEETKYRKKTLSTAQETIILADELVNGVKDTKDPIAETHETNKVLFKALNDNKNVTLTTFKGMFNSYVESGEVNEDNENLANLYRGMFILLKDNIAKDKLLAMNMRESANSIVESLILAVKSKESNKSVADIISEFHEKAISKTNMAKIMDYANRWDSLLENLYKS